MASKITRAAVAGTLAALWTTAAQAEVATAEAHAVIHRPIQFAVLLELDFGSIVASSEGGTVTLDPASGTRSCVNLVCNGAFSWSRLSLTGSDANVRVTYAPAFNLTGPGAPIAAELDFPGGSGTVVALTGGSKSIDIGARLNVNPGQTPGIYQGVFEVNVDYE